MATSSNPYRGFRFPAEVIEHAVWLYHCFNLGLRDVELILAARGIVVSYESIREWSPRFGRLFASKLKRRRPVLATSDGVDAPPDGITMCQGGDVFASHERREHPWKRLALSVSILQSGPSRGTVLLLRVGRSSPPFSA